MDRLEVIDFLYQEALPYLAVRGDEDHIRVSHQMALKLLETEKGDPRIVEPAIILHDVGWSTLQPEQIQNAYGVRAKGEEAKRLNRLHETNGAEIARRILEKIPYDIDLTDRIITIIETHDSGKQSRSPEESIVKDADKLWRYSKIGFWVEQERQGVSSEDLYQFRVEGLKTWFFTDTARSIAEKELKDRAEEMAKQGPG
jgi:HD superfamily phosphodiesterase